MKSAEEMLEYIVQNRAASIDPKIVAEIFDGLIWCLADNGDSIIKTGRKWLQEDDLFKIKVILAMSEVFPFSSKEEMKEKFNELILKWPELKAACEKVMSEWDQQFDA